MGSVSLYSVGRAEGRPGTVTLDDFVPVPGTVVETVTGFSLVDEEELPDGVDFTYVVIAVFVEVGDNGDPLQSGPSNFATTPSDDAFITAVNDPPLARADLDNNEPAYVTFIGAPLMVEAAQGVLVNDELSLDSTGSAPATVLSAVDLVELTTAVADVRGTVTLAADGSFTYTPPVGFVGLDTFTYNAFEFGGASPGRRLSPDSS